MTKRAWIAEQEGELKYNYERAIDVADLLKDKLVRWIEENEAELRFIASNTKWSLADAKEVLMEGLEGLSEEAVANAKYEMDMFQPGLEYELAKAEFDR